MSGNVRRNLAVQLTAGGTNPLKLRLNGVLPYRKGTAVNASLIGQGGLLPYAFSIIVGSLPAGLSLNASTGAITGTPTTIGANTFTAQVQDANSTIFTGTFEMDVLTRLYGVNVTPTPMENAGSFPAVVPAYSYAFTVGGATGTPTWSLTSGTLPPSLTISSGGVLSGTIPNTTFGNYTFTLTCTDVGGTGDTLVVPLKVNVAAGIQNGGITSFLTLTQGTYYPRLLPSSVEQFGTVGGYPPYKYSSSNAASVMPWATLDTATGFFSGTPPTAAPNSVVNVFVTATDSIGATIGGAISFTVVSPNQQIQPQQNGTSQGQPGSSVWNFTGGGVTVGNTGGTATVTIPTGAGGVTSVGATAPVASSGGPTPTISMPAATGSVDGYLSASAQTIGGAKTFSVDVTVNGLTIGKGAAASLDNTALGIGVLSANTTGITNVGIGYHALISNMGGSYNFAAGSYALAANTTGANNTAIGRNSLSANVSGNSNTAIGDSVLQSSTGNYNTGIGANALSSNTSGTSNTAIGDNALFSNISGIQNTAIGHGALYNNTGSQNVSIGYLAYCASATASGQFSLQNIIYGFANTGTGTTVSTGRIAIGQSTDDGVSKLQVAGQVKANNYGSALVSKGTITTAVTIDWTAGDHQTFTQTSLNNPTITFTAPANPCRLWLKVVAPASGTTGTMTWPATMKGSPPTTVTLAKVSAYEFDWDGTNYFYMGGTLNV